jgi:hypothetical protein
MKMTRFFIFLFAVVLTFSAWAKKVEVPAAMLAGKNFYFEHVNLHHVLPYDNIHLSLAKAVTNNDVVLFYIFNVNNCGFIIVSADNACTPVLGYSFENVYTGTAEPEGFSSLLLAYQKEVDLVKSQNLQADDEITSAWAYYSASDFYSKNKPLNPSNNTDVAPLLTSLWDQTFPYNAMCPKDPNSPSGYYGRCPVGCVATAMSQVMYYWRWPNQGNGNHCYTPTGYPQQCANFGNTTYDWNGMNNQPNAECNPVATLSWHTGISINMAYGPNGSGAWLGNVPAAMRSYFRYSNIAHYVKRVDYPGNQWHDSLQSNLNKGYPILYEGFNPSEGHCFVFDGYEANDYYHINWGWSGDDDGYYLITNLNPGGTTFNNNQGAVFCEVPDPSQFPAYCQGNVNVATDDFGSIEDGSGPVQNYQTNSNCTWLIAPDDSVSKITLSFDRFNLASGDALKLYDGSSDASPLIGTYTGSSLPPTAVSTGPSMFVAFTSTSTSGAQGFEAQYTATTIGFCSSSSVILTDLNGTFSDGSGRFQYRNSTVCKWRIEPTTPVSTIQIDFTDFNTEQDEDVVKIYDLVSGDELGEFSGNPSPPPSVTANTNSVLIMWNTNNSVRVDGWDANYSTIVGINEINELKNVRVYPNPATNLINVDFIPDHTSSVSFELLNLEGITLYSEKLSDVSGSIHKTINVSAYARGVYCLRICSETGISNKKIVLH